MATKLFDNAKRNKADEFYTQLEDIENELRHYKQHFKNKVVFCNCDDPYESNFFKYFAMNFNFLGLKKLICTCYDSSPIAYSQLCLFADQPEKVVLNKNRRAYKIEISEVQDYNNDGAVDLADVKYLLQNDKNSMSLFNGNGDFRSEECIELLKQADVVVTNPPFSLFREYVAQLIEYNKKFLIIGNINAITYKEIFRLIKEEKIWGGYIFNKTLEFNVPNDYKGEVKNGKKYGKVPSITWFTNLPTEKRTEKLLCYKTYNQEEYPYYVNYDAINVDKVTEIPCDYYGVMGVPITFLDKYNPEQFEIVALGIVGSIVFSCERKMEILKEGQPTGKYTINAKGTLYRRYNPRFDKKPPTFRDCETGELYSSMYARILIRRKQNGN